MFWIIIGFDFKCVYLIVKYMSIHNSESVELSTERLCSSCRVKNKAPRNRGQLPPLTCAQNASEKWIKRAISGLIIKQSPAHEHADRCNMLRAMNNECKSARVHHHCKCFSSLTPTVELPVRYDLLLSAVFPTYLVPFRSRAMSSVRAQVHAASIACHSLLFP